MQVQKKREMVQQGTGWRGGFRAGRINPYIKTQKVEGFYFLSFDTKIGFKSIKLLSTSNQQR
jgi:hypothetical protein